MIPEVFREDGGNYMVKAINNAGEAKCYATLVIRQSTEKHMMKTRLVESSHSVVTEHISGHTPPEFRKLFNDMRVRPGDSCKLQVGITGTPRPKVNELNKIYILPVITAGLFLNNLIDLLECRAM